MDTFGAVIIILFLWLFFRFLHLGQVPCAPELFYCKKNPRFAESILDLCSIFSKTYMPPWLWGKSGHLQTIIYAKLGRIKSPYPKGQRKPIVMPDGATMTYDLFEPHCTHELKDDYTFLIVPGIANSSEASYICTFVNYAQNQGYRVAVLNHLGAIPSISLTAPRIFTYGGTEEFHAMVEDVSQRYPNTKLLVAGFSMGGNIVVKYMGEKRYDQNRFLCVMSLCAGYSVSKAASLLMEWQHMRRGYVYVMTANQIALLRNHYNVLFNEETIRKYDLNPEQIFQCTSLLELDELYSRRRAGFNAVEDYYADASCSPLMKNIRIPVFLLNAADDPIVPSPLVDIAKEYVEHHENSLLVVTKHGGHLGYFEQGIVTPEGVTWLDHAIMQYANAIVKLHSEGRLPHMQ